MVAPLTLSQRVVLVAAVGLSIVAGAAQAFVTSEVARFLLAGAALAALAALVGAAIEQVGERLGPGPTGLLQSALGNLPELFVGIFALRNGLTGVVQAALVGSVLSNTLLVLGVAFLAGGLRHGPQRFPPEAPRMIATLLVLAVGALLVPTLAVRLQTPASHHAGTLSNICAGVLLVVYLLSIPFWLRGGPSASPERVEPTGDAVAWPLPLAVTLLATGSLLAALVSDWFVGALEPATHSLGISQTFTGLVIVAIASNAVENAVGIRFALKARPDFAISTILNSPLQIALLLTPALVLLSRVVGPTQLTLVFPPLLIVALAVAAIVVVIVVYDGEYTWLEGVALLGLYFIVAAAFWWG
ncbi:MAG TPA: calcium/proton exchanger [Acidimicrobiales bacterium]|jgi:Ca2+:H+ antiporter|nr:calcium/proton exchanger [Acidimicrobiales bacterium]